MITPVMVSSARIFLRSRLRNTSINKSRITDGLSRFIRW